MIIYNIIIVLRLIISVNMIYVLAAIYHALNHINYILCMNVKHISIAIFIIVGRVLNIGMLDVICCLHYMSNEGRHVTG